MFSPKTKIKLIFSWLGSLVVAAILIWASIFAKAEKGLLEVDFFDVGQGKSVFIEAPTGEQILIDGGPGSALLEKLSGRMSFSDREIDLVILTHPDSDHISGLIDVLKRYKVNQVIETGIVDESAENQIWEKLIQEKGIPLTFALAGQKIKIGDNFLLEILFPNKSLSGEEVKNTNQSSIVSRLDFGQISFLFTGDAEAPIENYLIGSKANIDSDILDIGHHGSKNSTSEEFLKIVSPEIAVIQVGAKNRYGHPHQELLERLKNIKIFRTDLCKDVIFISDRKSYQIENSCQ